MLARFSWAWVGCWSLVCSYCEARLLADSLTTLHLMSIQASYSICCVFVPQAIFPSPCFPGDCTGNLLRGMLIAKARELTIGLDVTELAARLERANTVRRIILGSDDSSQSMDVVSFTNMMQVASTPLRQIRTRNAWHSSSHFHSDGRCCYWNKNLRGTLIITCSLQTHDRFPVLYIASIPSLNSYSIQVFPASAGASPRVVQRLL